MSFRAATGSENWPTNFDLEGKKSVTPHFLNGPGHVLTLCGFPLGQANQRHLRRTQRFGQRSCPNVLRSHKTRQSCGVGAIVYQPFLVATIAESQDIYWDEKGNTLYDIEKLSR